MMFSVSDESGLVLTEDNEDVDMALVRDLKQANIKDQPIGVQITSNSLDITQDEPYLWKGGAKDLPNIVQEPMDTLFKRLATTDEVSVKVEAPIVEVLPACAPVLGVMWDIQQHWGAKGTRKHPPRLSHAHLGGGVSP